MLFTGDADLAARLLVRSAIVRQQRPQRGEGDNGDSGCCVGRGLRSAGAKSDIRGGGGAKCPNLGSGARGHRPLVALMTNAANSATIAGACGCAL